MTISKAINHLKQQYSAAAGLESIEKPVSYALYHTWKWANEKEKSRALRTMWLNGPCGSYECPFCNTQYDSDLPNIQGFDGKLPCYCPRCGEYVGNNCEP